MLSYDLRLVQIGDDDGEEEPSDHRKKHKKSSHHHPHGHRYIIIHFKHSTFSQNQSVCDLANGKLFVQSTGNTSMIGTGLDLTFHRSLQLDR